MTRIELPQISLTRIFDDRGQTDECRFFIVAGILNNFLVSAY
jgi:hypothetical protein